MSPASELRSQIVMYSIRSQPLCPPQSDLKIRVEQSRRSERLVCSLCMLLPLAIFLANKAKMMKELAPASVFI